ncbi:MAG: pitrilysin family protein [Rhizobacter sp.]
MLRRLLSVTAALAAVLFVQIAQAQSLPASLTRVQAVEGITEYRLANGLQLLLIPDDAKPTTTVNMTYHVGSRYENYGETGMAHLLEHLLFKGTPKHRNVWGEFTKRGLAANGSTGFDRTNYFASFSTSDDNLKWYLSWQADAMVNSFIARKDLDTEMTVVRNEMEMGENSPDRILYEKLLATMYQWHNYGKNTIGARTDVENVDIPRLQAFYRQYYQPDNATLIVAGKFDPNKVLAWVAQSFGKIKKPTRKLPVQYTLDPAQDGERSITLRRVGGVPLLMAGYHVPPAAHPDFAAVEVLDLVMGDTPAGRLHKRLTAKQLAAGTYAFAQGLAEPGFTIFGAQLAPGQDPEPARAEMLATIESVASEPVTDEELKRAQVQWAKNWEQAFTNPETVGVALSESVAQGDWRLFFLLRDRVRDLKLDDVQRVAEQRLLLSNRTLGLYLPTEKPVRAPAPAKVDVAAEMKSFKPQAAVASVEAFDATPANIDKLTQRFAIGGLKVALLPKGARGSAVQATLTLRFGDEKTLFGQGEVPDMVAAMLDKGTATRSRQQIQDRLDQLKTEMRVGGGPGQVTVSLSSRKEHLAEAIALVGDLLRNPVFPADALDELKRQVLADIEQQRKEPEAIADNAISRLGNPYPRGDVRYVSTFDETVTDVGALTVDQLRAFHKRFYGAARAEFGAAGDMDAAAVRAALEKAIGGWNTGEAYTRIPQPLLPIKPQRLQLATPDKQNATLLVRLSVPLSDSDADYPALSMANYLLGSGGQSRLWRRIRESEGLSYDVRSGVSWSSHESHSIWQASAIFAPQNLPKVEAAFKEELARALKDGFTAQELEEGKRGLLAFRRLSRAQDRNLAGGLANNLDLGRTFAVSARVDDALSKLTLEQVNAALRSYIKPDSFVSAAAGDFKP